MNIFSAISNGLKKLWSVIVSPKAQQAIAKAASLVELALPIVQQLSVLNPKTARVSEVVALYNKYGVPVVADYIEDPQSIGNALLNLATALLKRKLPANTATNIIQTAVQLAVTALKAK